MSWSLAGEIATATSAIVATATFVFFVVDRRMRQYEKDIQTWQKVIVYRIIRENVECDFEFIRSQYLSHVQQFDKFPISSSEIQDSSLEIVLLNLLEYSVIEYTEVQTYIPKVVYESKNPSMQESLLSILSEQAAPKRIAAIIYEAIDKEKRNFNEDSLYRFLTDKQSMDVEYSVFLTALLSLESSGHIARNDEGQLLSVKRIRKSPRS